MKLTVIIVSYNVKYYVEQCLFSLQRALKGIQGEVFVIDNHSRDESIYYLSSRFKDVHFIDSNHNLGFARANNIVIRQTTGKYVLLLNPDTIVAENTIRDAISFMDRHPKAGGAGVKMFNSDGSLAPESRRGIPTPFTSFLKMLGSTKRYYMSHLPWEEPAQIEIMSGAFCLLRRSALQKIGLLDEDFFMYGEDIDLSFRLLNGGFENWYLPFPIVHYKGESTQKSSFRYVHVFYQAMLIFFRKHYGHVSLVFGLPIKIAIYFKALIALVAMLIDRMKRSLGFAETVNNTADYVFVGSAEMIEACRNIAKEKGLNAYYHAADNNYRNIRKEDILTDTGNAQSKYCVFDMDIFAYKEVINIMRQQIRPHIKIGTYHKKSNTIITPDEIIK